MRTGVVQVIAIAVVVMACGSASMSPKAPTPALTSLAPSPTATPSSTAKVTFTLVATHDFSATDGFYFCCYVDIDPDGRVVTPEGGRSEILVLDGSTIVRRWGAPGTAPGEFGFVRRPGDPESAIGGIDVMADGSTYVVEAGNKRVQRFSASGEPDLAWGSAGSGEGEFLDPIQVAVGPSGEVYIVDDERNDIQVFTSGGDYVRTIGREGTQPGEMRDTGSIRIGSDGTLVNADFGNSRVQAWDSTGDFLWSLGSEGDGPGQFVEPQDVAFGPAGTLFVVDHTRVQVFDSDRRLIGTWPERPSPDPLASIALHGDTLWVVAPYIDALFEIRISGMDQ